MESKTIDSENDKEDENVLNLNEINLNQKCKNVARSVIRVLNTSYMCFFCLSQISFKSLNSLLMHFRLCHLRFKFDYEVIFKLFYHLA